MNIKEIIANKEHSEASKLKATALVAAGEREFSWKDFSVKIDVVKEEGGALVVFVRGYKGGKMIHISNPLVFINPPVMVPDGTKKKVKDMFGKDAETDNFKEDHKEAFRQIIQHAVELQAQ